MGSAKAVGNLTKDNGKLAGLYDPGMVVDRSGDPAIPQSAETEIRVGCDTRQQRQEVELLQQLICLILLLWIKSDPVPGSVFKKQKGGWYS